MDAKCRRLRDDWRGHFRGDLLLDEQSRGLYATDASLFEILPHAVAVPIDDDDLRFLVQYAHEKQIPIIPRGAGTGVAGESLGVGIVVDLSVHFRKILEIGSDFVRVQPGVVCQNLNRELAKHGRRFAPDPASASSCTIGGMLATNASGSNAARHGYTRDHVQALSLVFDNGEAGVVHRPHSVEKNGKPVLAEGKRLDAITRSVQDLLERHAVLIQESKLRTPFNRCGYLLDGVLNHGGIDLTKLLVGSEGTLAFFTEATLRTIPLAGGRSAVLFGFESLDSALRASEHARTRLSSACELLDRRLLTLTRTQSPEMAKLIPVSAEAVLLVEFERDSVEEARQAGLELIDVLQRQHHLAILALPAFDDASIERLWQVREAALPALYMLGKGPRPLAFIEDVGVPPEAMPEFLGRIQTILQRFDTTASFMIHAATGQIHARPFLDLDDPADVAKLWGIADEVHGLVIGMGGTISSQHGTGIARTPWVEKQSGRLFPVLRELKHLFDPKNILNPCKIVGLDPSRPAWSLRTGKPKAAEPLPETNGKPAPPARILLWSTDEMAEQVNACNGCGSCRTEDFNRRMCPMFHVTHAEAASPRAKANVLRRLLSTDASSKAIGADEVRDIADLCINCKMCATECPAHVNIPKLMLEAKAAHQVEHGLDRTEWILSRIESLSSMGSNFARTTNTLLGSRVFRWMMEKLSGLSRQRQVPAFAARNFLKRARRRGWTRKPRQRGMDRSLPRVAYFVDLFPNVFDPLIAEATVAVLHHHGIPVHVPLGQKACGITALSQGDIELARETVRHNLRLLAELVREGYTVVCSEPTAAVMLRKDSLDLIDDPDAALVSEHTMELTAFLWKLHEQGRLRTDFMPLDLSLGHHVPCHVKALGMGVHGPALLSLIPQLRVHTIDVSCSGMAGTFGLTAANHQASLQAGRPMLDEMARPRVLFGSTECGSCRMQMEQGSGKRTLHPVQYLALAYGLVPEIARKLRRPPRGLVTP
ncbi:MAG: FAD-binding protein [Planctomycetes bacterium]|nr:FAD-binding protein [Planctomycetota bacterium]